LAIPYFTLINPQETVAKQSGEEEGKGEKNTTEQIM